MSPRSPQERPKSLWDASWRPRGSKKFIGRAPGPPRDEKWIDFSPPRGAHPPLSAKAMKSKGYNVEYEEVPGGRHAMSLMHGFEDKFLDFFDAADTAHSQKPKVD